VRRAIDALGGIERFVKPGRKVVIKPNMTHPREPEYAVCTNPEVVAELVALCVEAGAADVVVFDRGGESQAEALRLSGIGDAVREAGGRSKELAEDDFQETAVPHGRLLRRWPLAGEALEADVLINVPIAKHHNLAGLTMSMKNLMGLMGGDRSFMHLGIDQKIVDLNTRVRPHLIVLDAHRVLFRNGPISNDLNDVRRLDTLVAGTNQVSVDAFGATLLGRRPEGIGYLAKASDQGLGSIDLKSLRLRRLR